MTGPGERPPEGAAPESVTFELRRIQRSSRRPRAIAVVTVAAFGALVVIGGLGGRDFARAPSSQADAQEAVPGSSPARLARATPHVFAGQGPQGRILASAPVVVVRLRSPSHADEVITTAVVVVYGRLEVRAATVRVSLEDDQARSLDALTIDTSDPDGGIRPVREPVFQVALALPLPRPEGRLWVAITAFDEYGLPLGLMRRPILIAKLATQVPASTADWIP